MNPGSNQPVTGSAPAGAGPVPTSVIRPSRISTQPGSSTAVGVTTRAPARTVIGGNQPFRVGRPRSAVERVGPPRECRRPDPGRSARAAQSDLRPAGRPAPRGPGRAGRPPTGASPPPRTMRDGSSSSTAEASARPNARTASCHTPLAVRSRSSRSNTSAAVEPAAPPAAGAAASYSGCGRVHLQAAALTAPAGFAVRVHRDMPDLAGHSVGASERSALTNVRAADPGAERDVEQVAVALLALAYRGRGDVVVDDHRNPEFVREQGPQRDVAPADVGRVMHYAGGVIEGAWDRDARGRDAGRPELRREGAHRLSNLGAAGRGADRHAVLDGAVRGDPGGLDARPADVDPDRRAHQPAVVGPACGAGPELCRQTVIVLSRPSVLMRRPSSHAFDELHAPTITTADAVRATALAATRFKSSPPWCGRGPGTRPNCSRRIEVLA